jgi:hypothetical protein
LRTKCDLTALAVKNGIEVLVKAEHDFYREKWQKEKEQYVVSPHLRLALISRILVTPPCKRGQAQRAIIIY